MAVIGEALRRTGAVGVVLAGGGPERDLLSEWMADASVPWLTPPLETVGLARDLLLAAGSGTDGENDGPGMAPVELAARALASRNGFLLTGTASKTTLLLSPGRLLEPLLPLADLYASEILDIAGECTVPTCLEGIDEEQLRQVDQALQRWLEEDALEEDALTALAEPLRLMVREALLETANRWIPGPLVPRFRSHTAGIDLDL
jgi:hypothetical protein